MQPYLLMPVAPSPPFLPGPGSTCHLLDSGSCQAKLKQGRQKPGSRAPPIEDTRTPKAVIIGWHETDFIYVAIHPLFQLSLPSLSFP